jgi:acyl-coenzyme A synthetase/AMP-(fatty) acid ligase
MTGHRLWNFLAPEHLFDRKIWGVSTSVTLGDLIRGSSLGDRLEELRGRSVLVATKDQLTAALAFIELDGSARRIVLWPPDLSSDHVPFVIKTAALDAVVSDQAAVAVGAANLGCFVACSPQLAPTDSVRSWDYQTEWILFTSGTTDAPKMVVHTLSSLTGAIKGVGKAGKPVIWSTFYDIRRYGGLQIFLRALVDGGSLVLSSSQEPTGDFITRAGAHGVTHISGTPSHWRRALMSPSARKLAPQYIRLSGEIADQAIIDSLQTFYKGAKVAHAFASTEGGLAFDVDDGLAGFPASLIDERGGDVELNIEGGSLRIRSARTASRYLGNTAETLADPDGFVDTRDMVELRAGRYYFVGRRDGMINVGGQKVHPEEIETVINRHPSVQMSLVKARRSPITGAVVIADVVVKSEPVVSSSPSGIHALKSEILEACRRTLAPYKVPATIRFVPSLEVAPSGKLARFSV